MLTLHRLTSSKSGTKGVFVYDNHVVCLSLELPWLGNLQNKSCIPCGIYPITKETHLQFGNVFRLANVPQRSGILIHPGNTLSDTEGCILPGLDFDVNMLKYSRFALTRLYSILGFQSTLTIRNV